MAWREFDCVGIDVEFPPKWLQEVDQSIDTLGEAAVVKLETVCNKSFPVPVKNTKMCIAHVEEEPHESFDWHRIYLLMIPY